MAYVVTLTVAFALFSACAPDEDPLLDGPPVGAWVSSYGETYTITDSEFEKSYGGSVSYSGTITRTQGDGSGAGYITIKYTQYTEYDDDYTPTLKDAGENDYYVIHWRELRAGGVELSDAYGAENDEGLPAGSVFVEKDLASITVANGYFNIHSVCKKQ